PGSDITFDAVVALTGNPGYDPAVSVHVLGGTADVTGLAAAGTVGTVDGPSGRVSVPGLAVGNSATAPVTIAVPADAEPGDVIRVAVNASAANQRQAIAPRVVEVTVAADAEPTATPKPTPTVTVTVTAPTPTVTT